jgi:cytochrome P450
MWNYLAERVAERRESPQDNMISDLIQARIDDSDDPTFSDIEIIKIVRSFLVAGNETTTTAIGSGLLTLIQDPSLAESIFGAEGADSTLLRLADEIVRLQSPVQVVPRVTTVDTELGGKHLPKGTLVLLGLGSANRDEAKFEMAECFNLERKNVGQHLGFGSGIHRCIGAMLARMEIKVAMKLVFAKMDNIKLTIPADELAYEPSVIVRSLIRLPATFTRRAT